MELEYSTIGIRPTERLDFWRDAICAAYLPISCETSNTTDFQGRILLNRLSRFDISHVSGSPQRIIRQPEHIARSSESFFMLSVQLNDVGHLTQRGQSVVLRSGDIGLYSTSEPYEIQCASSVDQIVIQIPADDLLMRIPNADLLTGMGLSANTDIGRLVSSQLQACASAIATQSEAVQRHMQDIVVDLIATGLSSLSDSMVQLKRPDQLLLTRAKSVIHVNLRNEGLNPALVAEKVGMSQRNLARIFQREGNTLAGYIRQARLQAIASDLINPTMMTLSISQIACKWGISNFQHFSKLFKATYGLTARDYRVTKRCLQ